MRIVFAALITVLLASASAESVFAQNVKVERVQRALVLAGFDPGPVDGFWGQKTRDALKELAISTTLIGIPEGPDGFDMELDRALVKAFNVYAEREEVGHPYLQQIIDVADARHLLERSGIGAHPSEIGNLIGLTRSQAISHMIARLDGRETAVPIPQWIDAQPFPHYWIRWDYEEEQRQAFRIQRDGEMAALRDWWVREMIATQNPQAERLILLWQNHFVSAYSGVEEESHAVAIQHRTFRELGHGNFRDLAQAMIKDPAMLNYLDNNRSGRQQPNENLARELMELFVLGEGNYSETTVREVARALTGNSYSPLRNMEFTFNHWDHDPDQKTIFGQRGRFKGVDVVNILLKQDATAEFIAKRFWSVYISEFNVDPDELKQVAQHFRGSDYDIKVLLRAILTSQSFWSAKNRGTIVKSPVDLFIGTIRSTGILPNWWSSLPNRMSSIGQNLFEAPNVAGWPGGGDWLTPSRLLLRSEMIEDIASAEPAAAKDDQSVMMANMMAPLNSDDAATRPVFIRYAAEDFRGSPRFNVYALAPDKDGNPKSIWESGPVNAIGGIDTERFGRVENSELPWQISRFEIPSNLVPTAFRVSFLNDRCCGPGGSDGGDRNFYLQWLTFNGQVFPASRATQKTQCSDPDSDRQPGRMYCGGSVTFAEFEPMQVDSPELLSNAGQDALTAERVGFEWADALRPDQKWVSFSLGLLAPRAGKIASDAMVIRIVREKHERGRRVFLMISAKDCSPDCLGGPLPRAAYVNRENGDVNISLPLSGPEWDEERAQWNQLSDDQRRFVAGIWMAVPDLITAAKNGRNWRERNGEELYNGWAKLFEEIAAILPQSRYAKVAPKAPFQLIPDANGPSDMMMSMIGLGKTEPLRLAGLFPDSARFDAEQWQLKGIALSEQMLATKPVQADPKTGGLRELLSDPVFNLK
jgi:uncharacterized protein (DUF1800 family)